MINEQQATIKETAEELIVAMGFQATVDVQVEAGETPVFFCNVRVAEGQNFLIGQYGMNLAALQHLIRILTRKKVGEKLEITVDVNDYFREKRQLLEKEASEALQEVLSSNASVTLRPMLPYERKVVHAFLSGNDHVMTESVGEGEERKVVVRPRLSAA